MREVVIRTAAAAVAVIIVASAARTTWAGGATRAAPPLAPRPAADAALRTVASSLDDRAARFLGFVSADDARRARIAEPPFRVLRIDVAEVTDPAVLSRPSLVADPLRVLKYPVAAAAASAPSWFLTVGRSSSGWHGGSLGDGATASLAVPLRSRLAGELQLPLDAFALVEIPDIGGIFVGHAKGPHLRLWPLGTDARWKLEAGRPVDAEDLLRAVFDARLPPPPPPPPDP